MTQLRKGRRRYYDFFSSFYDAFIRLHSPNDIDSTRDFLVDAAQLGEKTSPRILDVCCGTGSVILAFQERYPHSVAIGYDFSPGMLRKAREKDVGNWVSFVEGDAAELPFEDNSFDLVLCSHALYELKGAARQKALLEMKRVVRPEGKVLLMEHEVPKATLTRFLFYLRIQSMGSDDAREFIGGGVESLQRVFSSVSSTHSPSGKSKLFTCHK